MRIAKYKIFNLIFLIASIILIIVFAFAKVVPLLTGVMAVAVIFYFYMIDKALGVKFTRRHYILFIAIVFFGLILYPLYEIFSLYDKILHFALPILYASIVYFAISKLEINFRLKLAFVFFVVIGTLTLFEIGEYLGNIIFGIESQGVYLRTGDGGTVLHLDAFNDTMIDLSLGVIGALLYLFAIVFLERKGAK